MSADCEVDSSFLSNFQMQRTAFRGLVSEDVYELRIEEGAWAFGTETIKAARRYFQADHGDEKEQSNIEVGLVNQPYLNATWRPDPAQPGAFAICFNKGLVEALRLVASDVFGHGDEEKDEPLKLGFHDSAAADRVSERVGAFLEMGFPLGNAISISDRRRPFVNALVEDALQFLVLHEFAHILLGHDKCDIKILQQRMTDLQIATFSIGQEHQADRLAARLHASMRRSGANQFTGMEFAGPTLLFGLLGVFQRYNQYEATFGMPDSHPSAYERLYRLRVDFSGGDGHMYWPYQEEGGLRLARLHLEPNPEAVRFADAVAKSLLSVLENVERREALPSPINSLFNRLCKEESSAVRREAFWDELVRWLYLGSPDKVIQHLVEARRDARSRVQSIDSEEDHLFYSRAVEIMDDAFDRLPAIEDRTVKRALETRVRSGIADP